MHKVNWACTRDEILSRLSLSYTSMATNADHRKWRIGLSASRRTHLISVGSRRPVRAPVTLWSDTRVSAMWCWRHSVKHLRVDSVGRSVVVHLRVDQLSNKSKQFNRAVYTRESKPRITQSTANVSRELSHLYDNSLHKSLRKAYVSRERAFRAVYMSSSRLT